MPVMLGMIGTPGLLIIALIVLLLFGNRIPLAMRSMGLGISEFKKGMGGDEVNPKDALRKPSGQSGKKA